ncbi:MAG: hypothetical protein ABIP02_09110, partial [Arenimonas sp.]
NYAAGEMRLKVLIEGTQLKAQMAGQPAVDLFAESPDNFFLTVVDATLKFASGKGSAASVTLNQGGNMLNFVRTP